MQNMESNVPLGNEFAAPAAIAEPGQVMPSDSGQTDSFADDAQKPDVAAIQAERDAALRKAATYQGNLEALRTQYTANEQKQLALQRQLETLQQSLDSRKAEEDMARMRDQGATETELARYTELYKKEQDIKAQAALIEQLKPVIQSTRAEQERGEYLKYAVGRANGLLESKGLKLKITPEEVAASFTKPPEYQGEVEAAIQDLVLSKITSQALSGRKATLETRAAAGVDNQVPQGQPVIGSLKEAEKALAERRISVGEFAKYAKQARLDKVGGY